MSYFSIRFPCIWLSQLMNLAFNTWANEINYLCTKIFNMKQAPGKMPL
jgi:hypothetical protein